MKTSPRTVAVFALFVLLALGIRLTYLFQASQPPVGRLVILDSQVYQSRALEILKGQLLPTEVFRMSPAYPCMLAAVLAHLAQLYASVGERKPARLVAEKGLERCPNYGRLLHIMGELASVDGDLAGALEYYRRATKSEDAKPSYFFRLAKLLMAEGRLDDALEAVTAGLKKEPENVEGLVLLTQLQRQKGD